MMKTRLGTALAALLLAAACHRGSSTMQREQKSYQVVQEGQASGVTSTINAPGETPAPMTNTSADTTSNFTLAPNVDTTGTVAPGTIAGTMPAPMTPPPPRVITTTQPQQPPRVVITNTNPQPAPQQKPAPPKTDTTATTTPPPTTTTPSTDTTATTAPPPSTKTDTTTTEEKKSDQDQPENPPPPPPPPTQTDTRGQ